jgi:hypothetical protein
VIVGGHGWRVPYGYPTGWSGTSPSLSQLVIIVLVLPDALVSRLDEEGPRFGRP